MVELGKIAPEMRAGEGFSRAPLILAAFRGGERCASRRRIVVQCLAGVGLFFLVNGLLFGSGFYFRWVAPQSSAGTIGAALVTLRHIPPDRTAILALGDSRVSEGFSPLVAQRVATDRHAPYRFFNAAVPGTTPRVWFYLLRQLRDPQHRLAAVVVMLTTYRDNTPLPLAQRGGDIAFLHPLLRLDDLADFPWSFPSAANRLRAVEAILLRGLFYGADLRDFLADPASRIRTVRAWRRHGYDWLRDYPGRAASLAGLAFDPASGMLTLPPGRGADQTSLLPGYAQRLRRFDGKPPDNAPAAAYRRRWLGRIAALCRQAHVPLFVYLIPRGPLDYLDPPDAEPGGVLADMRDAGLLQVLPAGLFAPLERPNFFFDRLHLDRAGRQRFSAMLARAILQRLPAAR